MTSVSQVQSRLKSTAGYTIDQTILIVAIIAILVTLIILSVGWQLINRTSGTKLASQLKQIEDSNGQFYASFRVWPDESYSDGVTPDLNMMALTGTGVTYRATVPAAQQRNFIPGFRINAGTVEHSFASGGTVTMERVTNPFGLQGPYLVMQMTGVPFSEVIEAERAIDSGSDDAAMDFATGRIVALTGGTDCVDGTAAPAAVLNTTEEGDLVTVCYAGNLTR